MHALAAHTRGTTKQRTNHKQHAAHLACLKQLAQTEVINTSVVGHGCELGRSLQGVRTETRNPKTETHTR